LKRYHIIVQEDLNDVRICQEGTLANESDLYQRGGTIDSVRNVYGIEGYKETKAPVALYYFYKDKKGLLSEEKEDYKCYYPFLDFSPELIALREAEERGIHAAFIDLPYGEILIGTEEKKGIRTEGEKQTYNDDYLLSRSRYLTLLCQKAGLRNFDELWEKYFEIGGLFQTTEEFVRQMSVYCSRRRHPSASSSSLGVWLLDRSQ